MKERATKTPRAEEKSEIKHATGNKMKLKKGE